MKRIKILCHSLKCLSFGLQLVVYRALGPHNAAKNDRAKV